MKGLIEGRIVHYVPESPEAPGKPGWHRAAIVTLVPAHPGPESDGTVWLTVFHHGGPLVVPEVPFEQSGQKPNTWHWIEGTNDALRAEVKAE